jgi:hypothetical protein
MNSHFFLARIPAKRSFATINLDTMVSTRSSSKNPASARDISTLESATSQEKLPAPELHSDSEEDSDDEAPEAISTSTSKSAALQSEQAERQAKLK